MISSLSSSNSVAVTRPRLFGVSTGFECTDDKLLTIGTWHYLVAWGVWLCFFLDSLDLMHHVSQFITTLQLKMWNMAWQLSMNTCVYMA